MFFLLLKDNVAVWLKGLHLEAYERVFASAGYRNKDDLESLKPLKSDDLKKLGITKKGMYILLKSLFK